MGRCGDTGCVVMNQKKAWMMALAQGKFPMVETTATSDEPVNATSHPVTMPSGINVGDLILVFFSTDGTNATINTGVSGNNWTEQVAANSGTNQRLAVFWKVAEGSDALTITTNAGQISSHISYRISEASSVTGSTATGDSATGGPPEHDAGSTASYLWFAAMILRSASEITGYPSNYGGGITHAGESSFDGTEVAVAYRKKAGRTENPGTFTNTDEPWAAATIAVHP